MNQVNKDYPLYYEDHFPVFVDLEKKNLFEDQDAKILKRIYSIYLNTVKSTLLPLIMVGSASKGATAADYTKTRTAGSCNQIEKTVDGPKGPYRKLYTSTDYRNAEEKFDSISKTPILDLVYQNLVKTSLASSKKAEERSAVLHLVYQNLVKTSVSRKQDRSPIGHLLYENVVKTSLAASKKREHHSPILDHLYKSVIESPVCGSKKIEHYTVVQKFIIENTRINESIRALNEKITILQKGNLNGFSQMSERIFQNSRVRGGIDSRFQEGRQSQTEYGPGQYGPGQRTMNQEPQMSRTEYQRQLRALYIKRSLQIVALGALVVAMVYFLRYIIDLATDVEIPEKLRILDRKYNAMLKNPALFQAYLNNARDLFRSDVMRPPEQPDGIRLPGKMPPKEPKGTTGTTGPKEPKGPTGPKGTTGPKEPKVPKE